MIETAAQAREIGPGTVLVSRREAPVTRVEIAWYMVASYDLNPIHVDEPFAREAGFPSVIGQGMLPLGYLARELVRLVGRPRLRRLSGDFVGPVLPGDALTIEIRLGACREQPGGVELAWVLEARGDDGRMRVRGEATSWHASGDA